MICENPNITWEIVKAHPQHPWNYRILSAHPGTTFEIIKNNLDKSWNWEQLTANKNITLDILNGDMPYMGNSYISFHWDDIGLSKNPNITPAFVKAHPKQKWYYNELSKNPNFTPDDLLKSGKYWLFYDYICQNPNVTLEYILSSDKKHWNWWRLSLNRNITKLPETEMVRVLREYFAARIIQRTFLTAYYDPNRTLCQKRLVRECEMMACEL